MASFTFTKDEHIKYIIDNFDFKKVKKVMEFMNLTWVGEPKSPSISKMKKEASRLLSEVYDSEPDCSSIATGGFKASRYEDSLELEFIITDWTSEILNYGPRYEKKKLIKSREKKLITIEKNYYENS